MFLHLNTTHKKYHPGSFLITPLETRQRWDWALSTSWSLSFLYAWSLAKGSANIGWLTGKVCQSSRAGANPPNQGICTSCLGLPDPIIMIRADEFHGPSSSIFVNRYSPRLSPPCRWIPFFSFNQSEKVELMLSSCLSGRFDNYELPNRSPGFVVVDKHTILS